MTLASAPRARLRDRLAARPLLADGGMGTLMYSRGVPQSACLDELAAARPQLVGAAHREYLEAGAELIETLSLGANRRRLTVYGLESDVARLNRRAAQVAREAREVSGRDALIGDLSRKAGRIRCEEHRRTVVLEVLSRDGDNAEVRVRGCCDDVIERARRMLL